MGKQTWTKRPRYGAFQSTLDSSDNMHELKPSSIRKTPSTHTWRLKKDSSHLATANRVHDTKTEAPASVHSRKRGYDISDFDKVLPNSTTASSQQKAGEDISTPSAPRFSPPDPLMDELDSLIQGCERQDPTQHTSANTSSEKPSQPTSAEAGYDQDTEEPKLVIYPESDPISHDQLIAETKAIYAGLVLEEAKCIQADKNPFALAMDNISAVVSNLFSLHSGLIDKYYDFFRVTQHPAAGSTLRNLASKYAMPTRMWKHGVRGFLEAIRYQPHVNLSEIRSFLQETRMKMQQLTQTAPALIDEWTEMMKALSAYENVLENSTPKAFSNNVKSSESALNLEEVLRDEPPDQSEIEFGDLYPIATDCHPVATDLSDSYRTSQCSTHDRLHIPRYVLESLTGWLICGQALASTSFNIYCKVFIAMSLTAIGHTSWIPRVL